MGVRLFVGEVWLVQRNHISRIKVLAGDLGVDRAVTTGGEIKPGCADAPVLAQGLGQLLHLIPLMPVVSHWDELDYETRPSFLQIAEALHDLLEAAGVAGDVVVSLPGCAP